MPSASCRARGVDRESESHVVRDCASKGESEVH